MVQPNQIDTWHHFLDAFGKYKVEVSARYIVRFCQQRGRGWEPFSYEDITDFYRQVGPGDDSWLNRLTTRGYVVEKGGFYHVTDEFIARCYKASLVIEPTKPDGLAIYANDKLLGSVTQNPANDRVMNPGKWGVAIHTADEGLIPLGPFDTESEALAAAIAALVKNLTHEQWEADQEFPKIC